MKQNVKWFSFLPLTVALGLIAFACAPPAPAGNAPDFVGTWVAGGGGTTETLVITTTTLTITDTGPAGALTATVDSYDTVARHFQVTVTSSSGTLSASPPGLVVYNTYLVSGNQFSWDSSTSAYPTTTTTGPYTKM